MTEQPEIELGDYFEGSERGAPAISWDDARVGDEFEGIIVPFDCTDPKPYRTTQRTKVGTGNPLFWFDGQPTCEVRFNPDGTENDPVRQAEFTLLTPFNSQEFMSAKAILRAKETDDWEDDGTRRWFVSGKSADKALKAAQAKARVKKPQLGAKIRVKITARVPNKYEGKTNEFAVLYTPPTTETMQILADYIAANLPVDEFDDGVPVADPWAPISQDQEVPF